MLADDDPALFIISNERIKALDTPEEYAKKYPLSTGDNDIIYRNFEEGVLKTYSRVFGSKYLIVEDIYYSRLDNVRRLYNYGLRYGM